MQSYNMTPHKPTIIFLPGWGFNASAWETTATLLPNINPIYYELPVLKNSPASLEAIITLLSQNASRLPDNSIIAGWSLGGMLGTLLCHHFPHKFAGLITIATTPQFLASSSWAGVTESVADYFKTAVQANTQDLLHRFRKLVAFPDNQRVLFKALSRHTSTVHDCLSLNHLLNCLFTFDLRDTLRQMTQPVMHIYGRRDAILPAQCPEQMQAYYPKATIHTLDDAGHALLLSHASTLATHISHFIENIDAGV